MSRSPILFESTVGKGGNVDEVSEVDQHGVVFIPPRAGAGAVSKQGVAKCRVLILSCSSAFKLIIKL